ncbi:MAG: hypothetical protein QOK40_2258, partial [Miltoncostaeaceae bacterium]|nr:hypothetical protein [Miltoncostaeaceae bacterium]
MPPVREATANGSTSWRTSPVDDRFDLVRTLASAPGVETALARDLAMDRLVVVRRISGPGASASAGARLEHEAALLGDAAEGWLALPIEVLA